MFPFDTLMTLSLPIVFPLHLQLMETSLHRFNAPTYAYSFTCHAMLCASIVLYRRNSTGWYFFLWLHMLGSAFALSRVSSEPYASVMRQWIRVPMITSATSLVACHALRPLDPTLATSAFPTVYLYLHGVRLVLGVVRAMIFPARYISTMYDLTAYQYQATQQKWVNVTIPALYGARIDALEYTTPTSSSTEQTTSNKPKKWIVWFGGNGELAEGSWETAMTYANQLHANAIVFNYRGIGKSTGRCASADDMLADGACVLDYLYKTHKVAPKDLILFGHSLGGGVSSYLSAVKTNGEAFVINDRSFSSLKDAVRGIGRNIVPLPKPLYPLYTLITNAAFGDLDTIEYWSRIPQDRKLIIYHKRDNVIPYGEASLHKKLLEQQEGGSTKDEMKHVVELTELGGLDPHNSPTMYFSGHRQLMEILRALP